MFQNHFGLFLHWSQRTKELLPASPARLSFVLKAPLRYLHPSIIYSIPCDQIMQRAYFIQFPISHCHTFQVVTPNNQCKFFSKFCSEIREISEKDVFPKQCTECYTAIFSTLLHVWMNVCCTADFQTLETFKKLCESNSFVIL